MEESTEEFSWKDHQENTATTEEKQVSFDMKFDVLHSLKSITFAKELDTIFLYL